MVKPNQIILYKPPILTELEAKNKLSIVINGYPSEEFKYISYEDIERNRYFITSYGRIFTNYGRELFPEDFNINDMHITYLCIELNCTGRLKRRKFFVHRLVAAMFIPKTEEDLLYGRDIVNHKYNTNGKCNYVWNLEWSNISENTIHGIHYNSSNIDMSLYDPSYIISRKHNYIDYDQSGDKNPKSRISEFQARLICIARTQYNYSSKDCAIYAGLEGNDKDIILVNSILNGYSWKHISSEYGIIPKSNKPKHRASRFR